MELYDIVKKIAGEIDPVGETNTDNKRYENLEKTCFLTEALINDLLDVSDNNGRPEFSMNRSGNYAKNFLKRIHENLTNNLNNR